MMSDQLYESPSLLNQYLLFHYGKDEDQLPFSWGPHDSINFPQRCVTDCVNVENLPKKARALDLGCAVGRSSFELSKFCEHVVGVDKSKNFIHAAQLLQKHKSIHFQMLGESGKVLPHQIFLPTDVQPEKVTFQCEDVMHLSENAPFEIVLAANLICRLPNPQQFLKNIHHFVKEGGQLILITPYSWLEEFTARAQWEAFNDGLKSLQVILKEHLDFVKAFDMPFLMREHYRKYQWGVSQASLWIKK